ncbi:DUF2695 domain-containing protein [Glutamicibacter ardleyensis]|uniref:DUF2695 domain-containing protein n=1 Tax=Glutamicibacter ardleyensis TaxID=225894 RepID=UPI003FD3DF8D
MDNNLPTPVDEECLDCYLDRAIQTSTCDGTLRAVGRFTSHNRSHHHLLKGARGQSSHCDCEYRMNTKPVTTKAHRDMEGRIACQGVPRGSFNSCSNWNLETKTV